MIRSGLVLAALAVVPATLPGSARAAAWTAAPAGCYVSVAPEPAQRQLVDVSAGGFPAHSPVDVLVDGAPADVSGDGVADPVYADAQGRVEVAVRAPYQPSGQRPFSITVTERAARANTLAATPLVTALGFELRPAQAPPSRRVRFVGRGFTGRGSVWGHYVFGGKVRRTVRIAWHPRNACGTFSVRRRQIPIVRPHTGRWTLQVDQQRRYDPTPHTVFARLDITVQRVIRAR
jgi:hypothetical protein